MSPSASDKGHLRPLAEELSRRFRLSLRSPHGPAHWMRVRKNGLLLAPLTGANPRVVELFALFHDSCRHNDHRDPQHGPRGAELAWELYRAGRLPVASEQELEQLSIACMGHTHEHTHEDPTVATCWDADRLDLPRVGIRVAPHRLATHAARDRSIILEAEERALSWVAKCRPERLGHYLERMAGR